LIPFCRRRVGRAERLGGETKARQTDRLLKVIDTTEIIEHMQQYRFISLLILLCIFFSDLLTRMYRQYIVIVGIDSWHGDKSWLSYINISNFSFHTLDLFTL